MFYYNASIEAFLQKIGGDIVANSNSDSFRFFNGNTFP